MAGKKLAVNVTVGGETYPAGSTPPADVAEQITNPKAWGEDSEEEPKPAAKRASSRTSK